MSDEILDAARDVFEEYGARRANVDDVARKAGISRSTLYRRFPNKESLLAAVIDRETNAFLDELDRVAQDLPPQEAVIECFVHGMAMMREIPVLGRLAKSEPEMISGIPGRIRRCSSTATGSPARCAGPAPGCPTTSCSWWPSCCSASPRRSCSTPEAGST